MCVCTLISYLPGVLVGVLSSKNNDSVGFPLIIYTNICYSAYMYKQDTRRRSFVVGVSSTYSKGVAYSSSRTYTQPYLFLGRVCARAAQGATTCA